MDTDVVLGFFFILVGAICGGSFGLPSKFAANCVNAAGAQSQTTSARSRRSRRFSSSSTMPPPQAMIAPVAPASRASTPAHSLRCPAERGRPERRH